MKRAHSSHIDGMNGIAADLATPSKVSHQLLIESLQTNQDRLHTLIHALPDAVVFKDADGHWLEANEVALQLFQVNGCIRDRLDVDVLTSLSPSYIHVKTSCMDTDAQAWQAAKPIRFEQVVPAVDGSARVFDVRKVPVFHSDGSRRGLVVIAHDITERRDSERRLSDSEMRYRSLVENHPDAVLTLTVGGDFLYVNPAWERLSGYGRDELLGRSCLEILAPDSREEGSRWFFHTLRGEPVTYETAMVHKSGRRVQLSVTHIPMMLADQVVGVYGICKDITDQKRSRDTIQRMAYFDTLTGLPNRSSLYHHLATELSQRLNYEFGMLFIDLDNFKQMNDTFGHSQGDVVLRLVAERLRTVCRKDQLVVRWAGDEFIVLVPDVLDRGVLDVTAQSILDAMRDPFNVSGQRFYLSASIGIGIYPEDGQDAETLLRNGDTALQSAKKRGKNSIQRFHVSFHDATYRNLQLANALRTAIENGEMKLVYQPKYNPYHGGITGLEALLRWNSSSLGSIPPQEFIPLAEDTGLIVPIGEYVLETACAHAKQWSAMAGCPVRIAVNISVRQIEHPDFLTTVEQVLARTDLPSECLELEITESLLLKAEHGVGVVTALRDLGVRVSFDDFGTGYSSLRYLQVIPIEAVKIDKSFVDQLISDNGFAIVSAIIGMAHALGLTVIAEGVEEPEQLEVLKNLQCDEVQGYFYSRPLQADEIPPLLSRYR